MWHVLSLPGLGTVNNRANWNDRTLLAPSVSVLLYSLSCCFLSLKASWRHALGPTVGSRVHILPWESVSQDPTLHEERVDDCAQNKKGHVIVYLPHGFEKWTPTPQIVVPKNLDGASGFALNKVSVVFMGIMVWSSWSGLQWLFSWSGFQWIIIAPPPHTHTPGLSFSSVSKSRRVLRNGWAFVKMITAKGNACLTYYWASSKPKNASNKIQVNWWRSCLPYDLSGGK